MKAKYVSPTLTRYGTLTELTLGIFGNAPDVQGVNNINCVTGTVLDTAGNTVTITCGKLHS